MNIKNLCLTLIFLLLKFNIALGENGLTEITAEDGIEVFQKEKYYLLKKNVKIISEEFNLEADIVKAFFDKDLYDIIFIESEGKANLLSNKGMKIEGNKINLDIQKEIIEVFGQNSLIHNDKIIMSSDKSIKIFNINGKFEIIGEGSELKTNDIHIIGEKIFGKYTNLNGINEIEHLIAEDNSTANFKTDDINMYAIKAVYNKKENLIELFKNVKVIGNEEIILGDYAKINTLNKSYEVKSNESNNVKILIKNNNE